MPLDVDRNCGSQVQSRFRFPGYHSSEAELFLALPYSDLDTYVRRSWIMMEPMSVCNIKTWWNLSSHRDSHRFGKPAKEAEKQESDESKVQL